MAKQLAEDLPDEVCGIKIRTDFPGTVKSPDPVAVIEALVKHGTYSDAANDVAGNPAQLRKWGQRYPEIEEAYAKGAEALGYEAEQTMVRIMRGKKPPGAHEEAQAPTASAQLGAAKKLASINHTVKNYTRSQEVVRREAGKKEQVEQSVEEMSRDELLDALSEYTDE